MFDDPGIDEAKDFLLTRLGGDVEVGVILGSGLGGFAGELEESERVSYGEIPGFPAELVEGHAGVVAKGIVDGRKVVAFGGRFHLYQGLEARQIIMPVLLAREMGASTLVVTCSAGGVNNRLKAGDVFLVEDQINLMGFDPMAAIPEAQREPKFVNMKGAYDRDILEKNAELAVLMGLSCHRGVLAGLRGPSYETAAEIRWLRQIGADAVSMSTIPEAIFARYLRMHVVGISLITNRAADLEGDGPTHEEVLDVAGQHQEEFAGFLKKVISALPAGTEDA